MKSHRLIRAFILILPLLAGNVLAVLPNAWHVPDNSIASGSGGTTPTMRSPRVEFGDSGTVRVFSGLQKLNNPGYGTANQTGGTLFYKSADQGAWSSTPLSFHANVANDQYWYGDITLANVTADKVIQYYIFLTFDAGAENSYIYGGGDLGGSQVTNNNGTAAANPFTVRNRPAWIFHANNRVVSGFSVQFLAKVGYISDENDPATRWANNGAVYYTSDGSTPGGALGTGSGTTVVVPFAFSHPESNNQGSQSPAGTAMWWSANAPNLLQPLPLGATIKYKIGFWHSDNNEEKFADYQAGLPGVVFSFTNGTLGDPVFSATSAGNGTLNANYTTSKIFVDEIAGDSIPLTFNFMPGQTATEVELVTNLNQRDYATADKNANGIDDGMEYNQTESIIGTGSDFYYRSYPMSGPSLGNYTVTLNAQKTGAYRVTARWKVDGDPNWRWFTNDAAGRRDHAVTVSPKDARDISIYEVNTLTVEAKATGTFIERSTFEDLFDAPNAPRTIDGRGFNLDYLTALGVNWLWFQPIHPPAVDGREIEPIVNQPYSPGSPYAVKNFFEVNPWMSANFTNTEPGGINGTTARQEAMESFQAFVNASDVKSVGIMLDAPFNHTGFDVEFGPGADLFQRHGDTLTPSTEIRNYETRFFSRSNDYAQRATLVPGQGPAVAPDRGDFGKWNDVKDVYFGRYDALVNTNPADDGNYLNERDRFFYNDGNWTSTDFHQGAGSTQPRNVTRQVWKYFARYATHWLEKTRSSGQNRNSATEPGLSTAQRYAWDKRGIDGLRCDFGQGLPPQAWEYMINHARSHKWNFVMMAESLDGGAVTYRSNRHFDILNENIVFPLKSAGNSTDYRKVFEDRRSAYGQGLVLLNNTSHDEESYVNFWHPLMRYNVTCTVDGAPMIFMGQELGITRTAGFTFYETNFGKQVAHFKKFNSMQPAWLNRAASPFGEQFAWDAFSAAGQARRFSPALKSNNRWYLNRKSDGLPKNEIWAVAKYEQPNTSPNLTDVVFAFVNLRTEEGPSDTYNFDITANGSNLFGIKPGRVYNVKNIAAYTKIDANRRNYWLWPDEDAGPSLGVPGSNLLNNGRFVALNSLPASNPGWTTAPWEAQFLKLYDVTQPPAPAAPAGPNIYAYAIGNSATFSWTPAADPEGGVSGYYLQIGTTPGGFDLFNGTTSNNSATVSGLSFGTMVYARVQQINNAGVYGPYSSSSAPIETLDPAADRDGDGQNNAAEQTAGTNPLDATSVLKAISTNISGGDVTVTIATVSGKTYQLETSTTLLPSSWQNVGAPIQATGASTPFPHPGGAGDPKRFYRARVVP
jgi:glycosidase